MRTLAATLLLAAAPIAAQAADMQRVNDTLVFRGPIFMGDAMRFKMNLMAANSAGGTPIHVVRLNSPGGLVFEAMMIAEQVRTAGLDTEVEAGGMCASACFLPFAAGAAKHVGADARVGIHNASTTFGRTDNDEGTAAMIGQARSFGVPDRLLVQMRNEPSAEMQWLSDEELASMGATVTTGSAPVPLAANRADAVISASGNSWSDPATVKYDQAGSVAARAISEGAYRRRTDVIADQAMADFKASRLHHAITGD